MSGECDSEQSFDSMSYDGREILIAYLDMIIEKKASGKKKNFPKTFIEATVGYIGGPSKNGALKKLGFFTENEWDNANYYPECRWKWRTLELKELWNESHKPSCEKLERVIDLCKKAGYSNDHDVLDRLLTYMAANPGKHVNIETFKFPDGF